MNEEGEHDGLSTIVGQPDGGPEEAIPGSTRHGEVGRHLTDLGRDLRLSRLLRTELSGSRNGDENAGEPNAARRNTFCHERL